MTLLDSRKIEGRSVSQSGARRTWWRALGWWLWIAGGLAVSAQSEDALTRDGAIAMQPFEVSADKMSAYEVLAGGRAFVSWKKLTSPNFVVYTDAAGAEVRPMIEKLEMVFMATQMTVERQPLVHAPITVVMPELRSDWQKIRSLGTIRSRGKVKWNPGASSFDELAYVAVMEYNWQDSGVELLYSVTSNLNFKLLGLDGAFPIMRGLAYYFETAEVVDGSLIVGSANRRVGSANRRVNPLRSEKLFNWDHFFTIGPHSPEFVRDSDDLYRFDAQSALFVDYMLWQNEEQLWQWNALLHAGYQPSEALFQSVSGVGWNELGKSMRSHMLSEWDTSQSFNISPESLGFVVTETEVEPAEMRELYVLVQINNQKEEDSEAALDSLLRRGLKHEEFRPMLAGACISWKRPESALKVLQEMIATEKQFPEVYAMAADLLLKSQWDGGMPSEELLDEVRSLLTMALEGEPLLPTAIDGMTQALAMGPTVTPEQVEEIKQYCLLLQKKGAADSSLLALALASWRTGDEVRAKSVCDLLTKSVFTKRSARMLAQRMDQAIKEGETPEQMLADLNRENRST